MDAESQTLLIKVKKKIEELNSEIATLELKKVCPFYSMFGNKITCPYKSDEWHTCFDIDVASGNSDAWCTEMIERGLDTEPHYDGEQGMLKDNDWIGRF